MSNKWEYLMSDNFIGLTTLDIGISICLKAYALMAYAFGSVFLLNVVFNIRKGATSYQIYHNTPTFCM